jgi:hypothetical protein
MGHRHRRYNYSRHDGSPHYRILNGLIGFLVLLWVFNVWTAPPTTTAKAAYYQQNQPELTLQFEMPMLSSLSSNLGSFRTDVNENNQAIRLLPVHTAADGQKFVVLFPVTTFEQPESKKDHKKEHHNHPHQSKSRGQFPLLALKQKDRSSTLASSTQKYNKQERVQQAITIKNKVPKQELQSKPRGFSSPLFIDTAPVESRASSFQQISSSGIPRYHRRPKWSSWFYAFAITSSIVAGGLFAQRSLSRMDQWEQLSKEDSLAFDLAYTISVSNDDVASYGSFVTDWSGDYLFDRFDV